MTHATHVTHATPAHTPSIAARLAGLALLCTALTSCGGGGGGNAAAAPPPEPPGTVFPDLTQAKLLTDVELRTPELAGAPVLTQAAELAWAEANHKKIRSLTHSGDTSDLDFLRPALAGKRVVQLGESSHGSREFNQIKVRLIKHLHKNEGFNVIAFESSIFSCETQNRSIGASTRQPAELTGECLFGVWRTQELNELFAYIRQTHATARPLRIAGFDVQHSGGLDSSLAVQPWLAQAVSAALPQSAAADLDTMDAANATYRNASSCATNRFSDECARFNAGRAASEPALTSLAARLDARWSVDQNPSTALASLAVLTLRDRNTYAALASDTSRTGLYESYLFRDKAMAQALIGLVEKVHANEKVMVWAHNAHVMHETGFDNLGAAPMGTYLKAHFGERLFTIGLFMLRGASAGTGRSAEPVRSFGASSLEARLYALRSAAVYLPTPQADAPGAGDDWLHAPSTFLHWGFVPYTAQIDRNCDAVIGIDRSTLPIYN